MIVSDLLWALVGGTVVGVLGTLLAVRRRREAPLWVTVLCGVGGTLLGNLAYTRLFAATTPGFDWWRHGWQLGGAAMLVALGASLSARRGG